MCVLFGKYNKNTIKSNMLSIKTYSYVHIKSIQNIKYFKSNNSKKHSSRGVL